MYECMYLTDTVYLLRRSTINKDMNGTGEKAVPWKQCNRDCL